MLLKIEIKEQTTKDGWNIPLDYTIVTQVIGYRGAKGYEQWTLDPKMETFVDELMDITELVLSKQSGEYCLWVEGHELKNDKDTNIVDRLPVASVQVVKDYPQP